MSETVSKIREKLSLNSRISTTELAHLIKEPRHVIAYHREQLEKKGILLRHELLLNYEALGFTEYLIYLKIFQYSIIKDAFSTLVGGHKNIRWFGEVFPEYTVRIVFLGKKVHEVEEFIHLLEREFPGHLVRKEILVSRGLIKKESHATSDVLPNERSVIPQELSSPEFNLLRLLHDDPIQTYLTLARGTGLSIETVRQKIQRFQESGLIESISAKFESSKIGLPFWCVAFFRLKNADKHYSRLRTLLYSHVKFGRTRKTFGSWNVEMTLFGSSQEELLHTFEELEHFLGDDLESHHLLFYRKSIVSTRIPAIVFEEKK